MAHIVWNESCLLGVKEIDEQHAVLVGMINELHDVCSAGGGEAAVADIVTELSSYTEYHFAAEEKWMHASGYPDVEQHMQQHEQFNARVIDFLMNVVQSKQDVSEEVLDYLSSWLVAHIQGTDRKFGAFLKDS